MISGILALLGSSAVGTLLGGIFAFLNKKADLDIRKMELAHELTKLDKELEYAKQEAISKHDVAVVEADGSIETARMAAIAATVAADAITAADIKAAGSWGWVLIFAAGLNRAVRPIMTIVLAGTAIYLNIELITKLTSFWTSLTPLQQLDTSMQAFAWITGQAGVVIGYWFVSRGTAKKQA